MGRLVKVPRTPKKPLSAPAVKVVKKIIDRKLDTNIEDKRLELSLVSNLGSVSSAWTELDPISSITQTVAEGGRVGRAIRVKSIEIKGVLANASSQIATDDGYNVMRLCICQWQTTQVSPMAYASVGMNNKLDTVNMGRGQLEKVYLDRYIPLNVASTEKGAGDGYCPMTKLFTWYKRFKKPLLVKWSDDNATYPNHRIIISCLSDSSAITHPGFVAGYIYIRYEDA